MEEFRGKIVVIFLHTPDKQAHKRKNSGKTCSVKKRNSQGMGSSKVGRVRDLYKEKLRKKEEGAKLKI